MANPFDGMKERLHRLTTEVMGYDATWGAFSARVHFKEPDRKYDLNGIDFVHVHPEDPGFDRLAFDGISDPAGRRSFSQRHN